MGSRIHGLQALGCFKQPSCRLAGFGGPFTSEIYSINSKIQGCHQHGVSLLFTLGSLKAAKIMFGRVPGQGI